MSLKKTLKTNGHRLHGSNSVSRRSASPIFFFSSSFNAAPHPSDCGFVSLFLMMFLRIKMTMTSLVRSLFSGFYSLNDVVVVFESVLAAVSIRLCADVCVTFPGVRC